MNKMNKYKVIVPYDYISGYLKYGHKEMTIEANSEEEAKQYVLANKAEFEECSDITMDDYEIEDHGDLEYEYIEVEVEE